jgi:CRISPR-associated protein Cas2
MYVVLFYDIKKGPRAPKVLKYLRQKLIWIQNSVFEGEVTEAQFEEITETLHSMINTEKDSIIYYTFDSMKYSKREVLGIEKNPTDSFI